MSGHIYSKTICGNTYYYYQENYREKLDANAYGKTKGSGKSRVKSKSIYLGSAQQIFSSIKNNRKSPVAVNHRSFGLVAAAYQTAVKSGLVEIMKKYIVGERYGMPRWMFFCSR